VFLIVGIGVAFAGLVRGRVRDPGGRGGFFETVDWRHLIGVFVGWWIAAVGVEGRLGWQHAGFDWGFDFKAEWDFVRVDYLRNWVSRVGLDFVEYGSVGD